MVFVQLPAPAAASSLAFVDLAELGNRQVTGSHVVALPEPELGQLASVVVAEHVVVASLADHL